jgi:hypothetical protein
VGVYLAHDFGHNGGCPISRSVIVKAWYSQCDAEYITETQAYSILKKAGGICSTPGVLRSEYCRECSVAAIVMEYLGSTLETVRQSVPGRKFTEEMVLAVAIEMVSISYSSATPQFECWTF